MLPAQQCLRTYDPAACKLDLRLIMEEELIILESHMEIIG
jgi:hypothetical protein